MAVRWIVVALVGAVFAAVGCDEGEETEVPDYACEWEGITPCERNGCEACRGLGGWYGILQSSPPQYICTNADGYSIEEWLDSDYCQRPWCDSNIAVLENGDTTPEGFTADDLTDAVVGSHSTTLRWIGGHGVEMSPSGGVTELALTVAADGPVRYDAPELVVPETEGVPDYHPGSFHCLANLQLDVLLDVETAEGALDEHRQALVVQLTDPPEDLLWAVHGDPRIDLLLDRDDLEGSLALTSIPQDLEVSDDIHFETSFTDAGLEGELTSGVRRDDGDFVFFGFLEYARWP